MRLRECISATHYFAQDAIPQLLDKMNSSSPVVKIDTLQTLTACVTNYGPQTIDLYAVSMWDTIRFEILNANDEDVSNRGLELLQAITKSLSFGLREAASNTPLGKFLKVITDACVKELKDTEGKSAKPAGRILAECASVSYPANRFLIERTMPVLILLFRETNSVNKRTAILEILNGLLDSTKSILAEKEAEGNPLLALTDDLFDVYSKGFLGSTSQEATYKLTALDGFKKLMAIPGVLANNEVGIVVQYFNDIVLRDENEETWYAPLMSKLTFSRKVLSALADLAKTKPQLILDITFPAFLAELPDSESVERRDASLRQRKGYKAILAALAQISSERVIFEVLLRRLFSKLDIVLSSMPHGI